MTRGRNTRGAVTSVVLATVLLAGCSADGDDRPGAEDLLPEVAEPSGAFADLVEATAVDPRVELPDIRYSDQSRIRGLYAEDERWLGLVDFGAGVLGGAGNAGDLREYLGIDVTGADTQYSLGAEPRHLVMIRGNQDTETVAETAQSNGWNLDGDLLTIDPNSSDLDIAWFAGQVKLLDDSVLIGQQRADIDRVGGSAGGGSDSLLDDPSLKAILSCIGDPVAAVIVVADRTEAPVAVGVFEGDGGPVTTVMCGVSDDPQSIADAVVADTETQMTGILDDIPLSERIGNLEVSVDGSLVRAIFDLNEETPADVLFPTSRTSPIPGFRWSLYQ